jgi:hypothetical protein
MKLYGFGFHKALFLAGDAQVHHIAGSYAAHKNHHILMTCQALAFRHHLLYPDVFEYLEIDLLILLSHSAAKLAKNREMWEVRND